MIISGPSDVADGAGGAGAGAGGPGVGVTAGGGWRGVGDALGKMG